MGPLLAHFIVKSKGFIDHFILFFFILPCPIPFVYLCIHHSHISSSVQVPVVFPGVYFAHYPGASLICHWWIRCSPHFLSPFFVINLFPTLKHFYHFYFLSCFLISTSARLSPFNYPFSLWQSQLLFVDLIACLFISYLVHILGFQAVAVCINSHLVTIMLCPWWLTYSISFHYLNVLFSLHSGTLLSFLREYCYGQKLLFQIFHLSLHTP